MSRREIVQTAFAFGTPVHTGRVAEPVADPREEAHDARQRARERAVAEQALGTDARGRKRLAKQQRADARAPHVVAVSVAPAPAEDWRVDAAEGALVFDRVRAYDASGRCVWDSDDGGQPGADAPAAPPAAAPDTPDACAERGYYTVCVRSENTRWQRHGHLHTTKGDALLAARNLLHHHRPECVALIDPKGERVRVPMPRGLR